jgi:hypothetical protein
MPGTIGGFYQNQGFVSGGNAGDAERAVAHFSTYGGSAYESSHEKIIRELARELKTNLRVPGINPDETDLAKLCKAISTNLPIEKNGKKVSAKSETQTKFLNSLVKVMNKVYGSEVLDPNQDAEVLSSQVLELVSSLCHGLSGEHGAVSGEVKRVIKNLKDLALLLDRNYSTLLGKVADSQDETLKSQTNSIKTVYGLLKNEINRQIAILSNLFKTVVEPTSLDVATIMEENKEIENWVKRVKSPGSSDYSHKLMLGLLGAGNVALLANDVRRALKTIGMSVSDYKNAKDIKQLEAESGKLMEKKLDLKNPDLTEIGTFMRAVDILRNAEYYRSDVSKEIAKTGGNAAKTGGRYQGVDKRIKRRRKLRDAIFRGFNGELSTYFDSMVDQLEHVTKQLSSSIIVTEPLDQFVCALSAIPDIGKKYIYYSIAGYIDDTKARARREFFVRQLQYVIFTIDKLLKMDTYKNQHALLTSFRTSISKVLELVNKFQTYFASGWKISTDSKKAVKQGAGIFKETQNAVVGAEMSNQMDLFNGMTATDVQGGALDEVALPEVTKSAYRLKEVLESMRYFYNLAKAKYNLSKAANELTDSEEDYMTILGDGIGKKLENITTYHMAHNSGQSPSVKQQIEMWKAAGPAKGGVTDEIAAALQEFNKHQFEVKRDMYKTAEAIEVYLKVFSDAISKHPEEVKSLNTMLSSIELVAKWFTNKSGDHLCEVFDQFPAGLNAAPASAGEPLLVDKLIANESNEHYFERLSQVIASGTGQKLPGIPFLPIGIKEAKNAKKSADKALKSFTVIKNLVNCFYEIGNKFGGDELRKKTHMSPEEIYRNLMNYVWISAFVNGLDCEAGGTFTSVPDSNMAGTLAGTASVDLAGELVIGRAVGLTRPLPGGGAAPDAAKIAQQVTMDGNIGTDMRFSNVFEETDTLFIMCIKSLIAKPLTVVGIYNMFNRPDFRVRTMEPARMVLGGDEYPKVESNLVPLYVRLPLLVEFYRELFNFDGFNGSLAVSMVPEVDGLFSSFIELMFHDTQHVQRGMYSDSQVRSIIEEVNRIYARFGSKKETVVMDIINEFVAEINRRYGLVDQTNRNNYRNERRRLHGLDRDFQTAPLDDDYPILPGEDEPRIRMPAPSDAYFGVSTRNYQTDAELDLSEKQVIDELRRKIDTMLYRQEINANVQDYQFNQSIYQAQSELGALNNDKERFAVVLDAVQGVGKYLRHGGVKTIMFGETVVNSLNLLGALYSQLNAYRQAVLNWNLGGLEADVIEYLGETDNLAGIGWTPLTAWITQKDADRYVKIAPTVVRCLAGTNGNLGRNGGVYAGCTGDFANLNGLNASEFKRDVMSQNARAALDAIIGQRIVPAVFENVYRLLFGQDTDLNKLVNVRVVDAENNQGTLAIDHSNLKSKIEKMFEHVKSTLDKFRGSVPADDLEKFERNDNGSLYFLEERLLDQLIRGVEPDKDSPVSLDIVDGYVTSTLDCLKVYRQDLTTQIEREILGFGTAAAAAPLAGSQGVLSVVMQPAVAGVAGPASGLKVPAGAPSTYVPTLYNTGNDFQGAKSLFFLFNELLFKYVNLSFDPAAQKVYRKCLDNIAGGTFSDSITDPAANSYNDSTAGAYATLTGAAWNDIDRRVMTSTNAFILRHLLNTTTSQAQPAFVVQDLADVPSHMKERFRANFPFVVKCADTLIRRCELVKNCLAAGLQAGPNTSMLVKVVSRISQGLFSVRNAAADVMKELDDQPKYLEVSQGMLDYHRGLYGGLPLMPLSSTSCLLSNITGSGNREDPYFNYVQLPFSTQGTPSFKFRYGVRQLLGRPESAVSLDHMPWMKESLQAYNGVSDAKFQISEEQFQSYVQCHVELLRYFADSRHIRNLMIDGGVPSAQDAVGDNSVVAGSPFGIHYQQKVQGVYSVQAGRAFSDVLAMTESSFGQQKRMELAQAITDSQIALSRRDVAIRNLLDLNIVPINIRALMREVVLINLYNYSYTFDQMVVDMFGYHPSSPLANASVVVPPSELRNPKDVFVRLLIDPYQSLDMATYYQNVPYIMSGLIGDGLSRPKFIGDQFYNKALLGELYPNVNTYVTYDGQQTYHDGTRPGVASDKGYGLGPGPARVANTTMARTIAAVNMPSVIDGVVNATGVGVGAVGDAVRFTQSVYNAIIEAEPKTKASLLATVNGVTAPAALSSKDEGLLRFVAILIADLSDRITKQKLTDSDIINTARNVAGVLNAVQPAPTTLEAVIPTIPTFKAGPYTKLYGDVKISHNGAAIALPTIERLFRSNFAGARKLTGPGTANTAMANLFRGEMMTYIKDSARDYGDRVSEVQVGPNYRQALKVIGKLRFDTKLARNLSFVIMCQRTMRLKLHRELSWNKRVASGATLVDEAFTEIDNDRSSFDPKEKASKKGDYKL